MGLKRVQKWLVTVSVNSLQAPAVSLPGVWMCHCSAFVSFGLSRGKRHHVSAAIDPSLSGLTLKTPPLFLMAAMVVLAEKPVGSDRSVAPKAFFFFCWCADGKPSSLANLLALSAFIYQIAWCCLGGNGQLGVSQGLWPSDGALMNSTTVSVCP